jgi:hypothetical protein
MAGPDGHTIVVKISRAGMRYCGQKRKARKHQACFMRVSRSRCLVRKERQIALARGDAKLEMMARSMDNSDGSSDLQFTTKYKTTA